MPNDPSDELANLLNSLGPDPDAPKDPTEVTQIQMVQAEPTIVQPEAPVAPPATADAPAAKSPLDLTDIASKFNEVRDLIITNFKNDRAKLDEYIELYREKVFNPEEVPRQSFIDGLVALLTTRATATANGIKMLDSVAKMVAACKNVQAKENQGPTTGLEGILDADFDDDAP